MVEEGKTICIACSIFRQEMEHLRDSGDINLPVRYLESALHIYPEKLREQLTSVVEAEDERGKGVILAYGDCHSHMIDLERRPNIVRTKGANCCEILLGSGEYNKLRAERVFFLMPEWALRWREIFQRHLGLEQDNAAGIMQDMHSRLLYLDTGLTPVPREQLEEFGKYCGLEWDSMKVGTEYLLRSICEARERLEQMEV